MALVLVRVTVWLGIEWNVGLSPSGQAVPSFLLTAQSQLYEYMSTLHEIRIRGSASGGRRQFISRACQEHRRIDRLIGELSKYGTRVNWRNGGERAHGSVDRRSQKSEYRIGQRRRRRLPQSKRSVDMVSCIVERACSMVREKKVLWILSSADCMKELVQLRHNQAWKGLDTSQSRNVPVALILPPHGS